MKPEIRTEWTRRLRSGDIPQCEGGLARGESRCCLGVLMDMAVENGVAEKIDDPVSDSLYRDRTPDPEMYRDRSRSVLTKAVKEWAGLKDDTGSVTLSDEDTARLVYDRHTALTALNDAGASFEEIAE
jgi:hypothetical protein